MLFPFLCVKNMTPPIDLYRLPGFSALRDQGGNVYVFLNRRRWQLHLAHSDTLPEGRNSRQRRLLLSRPRTAATLQTEFRSAGAPLPVPARTSRVAHARVRRRRPRLQPPPFRRTPRPSGNTHTALSTLRPRQPAPAQPLSHGAPVNAHVLYWRGRGKHPHPTAQHSDP